VFVCLANKPVCPYAEGRQKKTQALCKREEEDACSHKEVKTEQMMLQLGSSD
jgi:hypothetical protein